MNNEYFLSGFTWKRVLLIFLFAVVGFPSFAKIREIEILKEEKRTYTINELRKNENLFLKPYRIENPKNKPKSYWLRFTYEKSDSEKLYYLFSPYILNNALDLYYVASDSVHHYSSGTTTDFEKRNLYLPSLYLKLPNGNVPTICWLHVQSFNGYHYIFVEREVQDIIREEIKISNFDFFVIGLGILATVFSLIFFIFLKDKLYFYYSVFSLMVIINRLLVNGYIFKYLNPYFKFDTLESIYNLYTVSYGLLNISLLFYFYEFLRLYRRSQGYHIWFCGLAIIRFLLSLLIHLNTVDPYIRVDNRVYDLIIQLILLVVILRTSTKYTTLKLIATFSLSFFIVGNFLFLLQDWGYLDLQDEVSYAFLNLAGIEVVLFAIGMAYRTYALKSEHDLAVVKLVENLKERELLKDRVNRELEMKVEQRTQQIQRMNELLKSHNIQLESEVKIVNEARVFQKAMDFQAFLKTFPDDDTCFRYLANLKWKANESCECKKCGYNVIPNFDTLSIRCGRCGYFESVTNNTLFHRLRFPIVKAFYIIYRISHDTDKSVTIASLASEIDLRVATLQAFRQKVNTLIHKTSTQKKHKDGWTHIIKYSVKELS